MYHFYEQFNEATTILIALSTILFSGFLMTRLTKKLRLPNVSGFILAGILIGPCVLQAVPEEMLGHMSFVSDVALAFIAFGVGKFFKKEVLRQAGGKVIVITVMESLLAGVFITLVMGFFFHLEWSLALILGAIATATAPASTMMTIRQYRAKGNFVNTLLQVVALDDVVCLLAYSIVAAIANANASGGSVSLSDVLVPVLCNAAAIVLGFAFGVLLSKLLVRRSQDNRLILSVAMLFCLSGICAILGTSPLLACMAFGAMYINRTHDKELFRQIDSFTPPIMSIFFIVSGMNMDIHALASVGVIGAVYFVVRILGKYAGAWLGCWVTKTEAKTRDCLGLALIPQAGVAIGLAFMAQRMLPGEIGDLFFTIILSSSVLYELIGPACAKAALFLSGAISREALKSGSASEKAAPRQEKLEQGPAAARV